MSENGETKKPITINELKRMKLQKDLQHQDLIYNAMSMRSNLWSRLLDERRDHDAECGYKRVSELSLEDYQTMYDKEGIAQRVVGVLPNESWKAQPAIYEDEDPDTTTDFESAWYDLSKRLLGDESWFDDEEGNPIWEYLHRIDVLSGIGYYGIVLLGVNDGKNLDEPLEPSDNNELTFMRVFTNQLAHIAAFEMDQTNPRFGKPKSYNIQFADPSRVSDISAFEPAIAKNVHWTRVLHIADTRESSEIFAVPRMRPVYNRLQDLRKLYGGSAEMYWLGAFPGLSFETHPQLGAEFPDLSGVRDAVMDYKDGLQRYLAIEGVTVKSIAPQVVDPTPQINAILEAICIKLGVPKRVFMGSERGELASTQDKDTWNERLSHRQQMYITPRIIVPFIDRLIAMKILPEPADGYRLRWPDLNAMDPKTESEVALRKTEAIVKYVSGGADQLIPPPLFLTRILGVDESEAEEMIEAAEQYMVEKEPTTEELMAEQNLDHASQRFEMEKQEYNADPEKPTIEDKKEDDAEAKKTRAKE
jgi:hypothetical protein